MFHQFVCDVRADGIPPSIQICRSDNGGEVSGKDFVKACRHFGIKQEFTPLHSPKFNGVAERGLAMIEATARAARIQAGHLYPNLNVPESEWLWAESMNWACYSLNRTCTTANPDKKSPCEMWFGKTPSINIYPFLKPAFC